MALQRKRIPHVTWADATLVQAPWKTDSALDFFERSIALRGDFGCWVWTAFRDGDGYGRIHYGEIHMMAHRFSYEVHRELIPGRLVLDHLCREHPCVNPWHLEPVTKLVNQKRGWPGDLTQRRRAAFRIPSPRTPLPSRVGV